MGIPNNLIYHQNLKILFAFYNFSAIMHDVSFSILAAFVMPHPPLIIHSVGRGKEVAIQKTIDSCRACAKKIAELKPQTIIVASPHAPCFFDGFFVSTTVGAVGDFSEFGDSREQTFVKYDKEAGARLVQLCEQLGIPTKHSAQFPNDKIDHGTLVPLNFVNQFTQDYMTLRVGLSGLSLKTHWDFGRVIFNVMNELNRKCVFIASGDLSHKLLPKGPYGFDENGPLYDKRIIYDLENGNFSALLGYDADFLEKAAQCGHKSFVMLGGAVEKSNLAAKKLSYEGPFGVGYGVCSFC